MPIPLTQPAGPNRLLGDHEKRIRSLEREPGGAGEIAWEDVGTGGDGGVGIQFGIENDGTWLDVRTSTDGPSSQGIYLEATVGSIANPGILLASDGIIKLGSNHVILGTDAEIDITTTVVTIGSNGAFYPRRIDMSLFNTTTNPQGSKVVIYDANGDSIFEVRDDGTFHIKTGASWAADL